MVTIKRLAAYVTELVPSYFGICLRWPHDSRWFNVEVNLRHEPTLCAGCGVDTVMIDEYWYLLRNEVWAATGMSTEPLSMWGWHKAIGPVVVSDNRPRNPAASGAYLCIGCVEERLGRMLTRADFEDQPVNDPTDADGILRGPRSERLADRLTRDRPTSARPAA
jgi:hypothetical protein